MKWYRKAAEKGHAKAQFILGMCFANGRGVTKDEKQAVEWFRKAAEQDNAEAQNCLGGMLFHGRGNEKDELQALKWFRKAAKQGNADAQNSLGNMYLDGRVVAENEEKAMGLFLRSARQGNAGAQFNLGLMFTNGRGVPKDDEQAVIWFRKAAEQGHADAKRELERLQSALLTSIERESREMTQKLKEREELLEKQRKEFEAKTKALEALLKEKAIKLATNQAQLLEERKKQEEKLKAETKQQQENTVAASPLSRTLLQIARKDVTLGDLIGDGSYGDVHKGEWAELKGVTIAIKVLHKKVLSESIFLREANSLNQCRFPSIVQLYGVCIEPGHYALLMEYMPISLRRCLQEEFSKLSWFKRFSIALDIARGLNYLHKNHKMLHRDLRSDNILLDDSHTHAKIADFGLAKLKEHVGSTLLKATGSIRWQAPELCHPEGKASFETDVYSMGMVFLELVTGELPYSNTQDDSLIIDWKRSGHYPKIPDNCPKAFKEIIEACWATTPEKRPKASKVVSLLEPLVEEAEQAAKEEAKRVAGKEANLQKPVVCTWTHPV